MPSSVQPHITEAPGGGLIRSVDPRHVPETAWARGRNIRFPTGRSKVRKTDGYKRLDISDPAEPIRALWYYIDPTGVSETQLLRINTSAAWTGAITNRTPLVDFTPTRTMEHVVTICQYKERVFWADGEVFMWGSVVPPDVAMRDVGTDSLMISAVGKDLGLLAAPTASLITGGPQGKLVELHKGHLLIGNITSDPVITSPQPWMVRYSVGELNDPFKNPPDPPGSPPDFTGKGSGAIPFLEDSTELTALKVLGDHCIVHKADRLYRMIFVGPPDYYISEIIAGDEGSVSARGPISVGSFQFYPGRTNFFRLGAFTEPIGDAIWPEVADAIDWLRVNQTYAYRRLGFDEICWKFPARGAAQPSLTIIYNFRDQTWTATDHDPGTCFAEIPVSLLPPLEFDFPVVSPPTTMASLLIPASGRDLGLLRSVTYGGPPVREIFGQSNGDIQLYGGLNANGQPIHAWIESRHMTNELAPTTILAVPVFATGTGTLWVQLRSAMELRQPMPQWPELPPDSARYLLDASHTRPWVDVRGYGRLWQVRLESTALNEDWEMSAYGTGMIPGGYIR